MENRMFRWLARLLPEEFRSAYARDMEVTFRAERRELAATGGTWQVLRLWLTTIGDVIRRAPAEHLDILGRDVRFAVRTMAARPMATFTAIVMLAVGVGANVAMFSVVDTVLLTPLAYRDPDRLVNVTQTEAGTDSSNLGYLTFTDLRDRSRSFDALIAASFSTATLTGGDMEAERVNAMRVSRAYFDMIGVAPALGRTFEETEDRPGAARRVAILGDTLWRRRFGADPSIVGKPMSVSGIEYRIIGILPRGFRDIVAERTYDDAQIWFPLGYDPAASYACRTCQHLSVYGRLAPGVTVAAAEQELQSLVGALQEEHPSEYHQAGARVTTLPDMFLGPVRPVLLVLWAGVAALLLVACGNVANLLLLRASERTQEIVVRTALGVTRRRLARQFLTESLMLATAGGAAGLALAWMAVRLIAIEGPTQIPRLADIAIGGRAIAVTLALVALSGMAFGLVPLRQLLRRAGTDALHGAGRRTESAATWRTRATLVTINVAMAALLLIGSGLLVRSLSGLLTQEPGFDPAGVLTMQVWATGPRFRAGETPDQIATAVTFYDDVLTRARALPGVAAAGGVTTLPLGGGVDGYGFHIEGRPSANPEAAPSADRFVVTPGFFEVSKIPLRRGRLLDERDTQTAEPVVVINTTAADALFPGEDPIGQRVRIGAPTAQPRRIVGIVGDVRHHGLDVPVEYQMYLPQAQWAWAETFMTLVIRTTGDPMALAAPMRDLIRGVDPAQPVTNVRSYDAIVSASTGTLRFAAGLLTTFAVTALLMAVVGLYGAVGVTVGQRRQELGLRMALGASAQHIRQMVLAQGLRPVFAGIVAGVAIALLSVNALRSMLFEIGALDPLTFGASTAGLAVCAIAACLGPAWRASRIDPTATLRG